MTLKDKYLFSGLLISYCPLKKELSPESIWKVEFQASLNILSDVSNDLVDYFMLVLFLVIL